MKTLSHIHKLAEINTLIRRYKSSLDELEQVKAGLLGIIGDFLRVDEDSAVVYDQVRTATLKAVGMDQTKYINGLNSHKPEFADTRTLIIGIMCVNLGIRPKEMAPLIGKERTTFYNAIERHKALITTDKKYRAKYEAVIKELAKQGAA